MQKIKFLFWFTVKIVEAKPKYDESEKASENGIEEDVIATNIAKMAQKLSKKKTDKP